MVISNDERREIAARLAREAQAWRETFPDNECDFSDAAAIMQDLCVFIGLDMDALCSEVFKRLADLIEPEPEITCNAEKIPYMPGCYEGNWCSVCHCIDFESDEPNYCPNCGAKVVE